jgi:hypothetical protein
MPTDEIRDMVHGAFERAVRDATVDPALLSVVRRRHGRQQRLLAVGAPLGVAVLTAGAVGGVMTIGSRTADDATAGAGQSRGPTASDPTPTGQSEPTQTLQHVSLVGHELSLPSGWRLSGNRRLIELDAAQPGQLVGGRDQSVTATSPDGRQRFEATVYAGPIGDAERASNSAQDDPDFTHVNIDGLPAALHVTDAPTVCLGVHVSKDGRTLTASGPPDVVEGPCPESASTGAPFGEARYTFGNGDFMMVDTNGMDAETLETFLRTALTR